MANKVGWIGEFAYWYWLVTPTKAYAVTTCLCVKTHGRKRHPSEVDAVLTLKDDNGRQLDVLDTNDELEVALLSTDYVKGMESKVWLMSAAVGCNDTVAAAFDKNTTLVDYVEQPQSFPESLTTLIFPSSTLPLGTPVWTAMSEYVVATVRAVQHGKSLCVPTVFLMPWLSVFRQKHQLASPFPTSIPFIKHHTPHPSPSSLGDKEEEVKH